LHPYQPEAVLLQALPTLAQIIQDYILLALMKILVYGSKALLKNNYIFTV
jgi:hypothetical protein